MADLREKTYQKGSLVVISGPSGVGKGTICQALIAQGPRFVCSVSATTRPKRVGEQEGIHYFFLAEDVFQAKIKAGAFLEWALVYDHYYGTLLQVVEEKLQQGLNVILEIDTEGGKQIKAKMPQAVLIYILPPNSEELENRLRGRATDAPEVIAKRLSCYQAELEQKKHYDCFVINHEVEQAVAEILDILEQKL